MKASKEKNVAAARKAKCRLENTLTEAQKTGKVAAEAERQQKIRRAADEKCVRLRAMESRVKRIVKRKLASRSKRPPSHGCRLNDTKFDEYHNLYEFIVEGCCDALARVAKYAISGLPLDVGKWGRGNKEKGNGGQRATRGKEAFVLERNIST